MGPSFQRKPISVRESITCDNDAVLLATLVCEAVKEASHFAQPLGDGYIGLRIERVLAPLGIKLSLEEYPVEFPDEIARAWGHSAGGIDLHGEYKGKSIGIEDESVGWYRACEPEILKLGWSDLDIRICAWGIRQRKALERFKGMEMLPFPKPVIVVTKFGLLEVSNDYSHRTVKGRRFS